MPWLLAHGAGLRADELADRLAEQVQARDLMPVRRPVDDIDDLELGYFPGAVVVLPDEVPVRSRLSGVLLPIREFARSYRARRPYSVHDARIGRREVWEVGALQAVGRNVMLGSDSLRPVRDLWCARHRLEGDAKVDLFEIFDEPISDLQRPALPTGWQVADEAYFDAVERLRRWNISPTQAHDVLDTVDSCRHDIERRPRRATMYRPIKTVSKNRLDLILDGRPPEFTDESWNRAIGTNLKAWKEADAAVWRQVYAKVRSDHPTVRHPNTGHTGAVDALKILYNDLRIVARSPRL